MNILEDIKLNFEEEIQLRKELEKWKLEIKKNIIIELEFERNKMDIFTMMLDGVFYKFGIRFIASGINMLSKDIKVAMVDYTNTQYWRQLGPCDSNKQNIYRPVRMLIGIRKYLALKSCGAYEKIRIRGKE